MSIINYQLSIVDYQLSIVNYQLSIINCQLSIINYQLSIVDYQLSIVNYQLSIINYQLSIINYQLSIVNYQLSIINCRLSIINYQLSIVNYQLSIINYQLSIINLYKLAIILIRLISRTWRIRVANPPEPKAVIAFWHGEMLPLWRFFAFKNASAVVSQSKDGEILSSLLKKWKYKLYRGSSSKGGSEILNQICTEFDNDFLLITPDGPRGPAQKFKAGAAVICQRKQIPLVLCSVKIHSTKLFNKSWDSFEFPLPFSKIEVSFSDKINIPKEATREEITQLIKEFEERM